MDWIGAIKLTTGLGMFIALILFLIWLYRKGVKEGYRKGCDDVEKKWKEKMASLYMQATNPDDFGFSVRNPTDGWGMSGINPGQGVESKSNDPSG